MVRKYNRAALKYGFGAVNENGLNQLKRKGAYTPSHMLVNTKRGILCKASGGVDRADIEKVSRDM